MHGWAEGVVGSQGEPESSVVPWTAEGKWQVGTAPKEIRQNLESSADCAKGLVMPRELGSRCSRNAGWDLYRVSV